MSATNPDPVAPLVKRLEGLFWADLPTHKRTEMTLLCLAMRDLPELDRAGEELAR